MKRAPRSRQRHDLYAKYHDYDSEISDLLGECGFIMVSASVVLLSGCVTESSYNQAQEVLSGSPSMKRDVIERCYRGANQASPARKAQIAKIMNVSPRSNVARTYCTRTFNAIAAKKISYSDFRNKTPRFIRAIQGR